MFPQVKLRTEVVHNSIDTDLFSPGNQHNRSFKIGSIGLITPKKRFYELIIAFEQLTRYIPQLKLKIGGPFLEDHYYYNTVLQELPFRLNINDKVSFDGDIPCRSTSLISWYRALDIYITNSYFESFSVAMHEAMACGCLALSHSWDGAEEFIPEDRIYTDDRDLILKILKLYEMDLTKWNLERKNIRKNMVYKFGGNAQTNKLIQLIEETYHR